MDLQQMVYIIFFVKVIMTKFFKLLILLILCFHEASKEP